MIPEFGPSLSFPIGRLPWRDATVAALPGAGGSGQDPDDGPKLWKGTVGVDAKWEHCLTVVDANGNIVEQWTQWDKIFKRPHFIAINPYDPEKHVWVVDDHMHAIYKFTHDGKTLVQTIGTPTVKGADGTHFNRPTFLNWLPDSTLFVSDGYNGTRVAKFDKDGKFLLDWGMKGTPPNEKRPYYMNNVHGMALDAQTRHVFVNDRANHRIQVFDENGKFLYDFSMGQEPSDIHLIYIGADRALWAFDRGTSKMLKYDLEGHFLYSFGTWGDFPGGFWGVHGFSVDQEGNFYVAEVDNGRVQKFRPRQGCELGVLSQQAGLLSLEIALGRCTGSDRCSGCRVGALRSQSAAPRWVRNSNAPIPENSLNFKNALDNERCRVLYPLRSNWGKCSLRP